MQSFSSRIWTRIAVSIYYDDNHYTTGTSIFTAHVFIPFMSFLLKILASRSFLVFWRYSLLIISFISACLMVSASNPWSTWLGRKNTPTESLNGSKTSPLSVLDMTLNNGKEDSVILELWEMLSTFLLSLHLGPLWPGVVIPDRDLFMG